MATKLDKVLQPGERVLFRTRIGWRRVLWSVGVGAATAAIYQFIFPGSDVLADISYFLGAFIAALLLVGIGTEAAVTDLRVLHRSRLIKRKVVEIPLPHILIIEDIGLQSVSFRDRAGTEIMLDNLADPAGLAAEIEARTGMPTRSGRPARVEAWQALHTCFAFGCGLALMLLLLAVFTRAIPPEGLEVAADFGLDRSYAIRVTMVLITFAGSVLLVACLIAGFSVGQILLMPVLRLSLSVEEARSYFSPKPRHGPEPKGEDDAEQSEKWCIRIDTVPSRRARRLASLLYGEPV